MEKNGLPHLIYMICINKWDKMLLGTVLFLVVLWCEGEARGKAGLKKSKANYHAIKSEEIEASFPGGDSGWACYLRTGICRHIGEVEDTTGTCAVLFAIDTDGIVRDVQAKTMQGTIFAKVVVETIEKSPRWRPARMSGKVIKSYRSQKFFLQPAGNKPVPCECVCHTRNKRHSA